MAVKTLVSVVVGERRIRVHTMCLPVTSSLADVFSGADQKAIVGLLGKMGELGTDQEERNKCTCY